MLKPATIMFILALPVGALRAHGLPEHLDAIATGFLALPHGDLGIFEQVLALACAILILGRLLADDEPIPLAVDLQDLDGDPLADQRLQAAGVSPRHLSEIDNRRVGRVDSGDARG